MNPACPYLLPWNAAESKAAQKAWKANCGPHSIAAALSVRLDQVHDAMGKFPGYTNPTKLRETLRALQVPVAIAGRVKTMQLCDGLSWIQWEGDWLDRGEPEVKAYRHSHWVAHWAGWVLCTAIEPYAWLPVAEWRQRVVREVGPWHARAHYRLYRPPARNNLRPVTLAALPGRQMDLIPS